MLVELAFVQNRKIVFYITVLKKKGGKKKKEKATINHRQPNTFAPKDRK